MEAFHRITEEKIFDIDLKKINLFCGDYIYVSFKSEDISGETKTLSYCFGNYSEINMKYIVTDNYVIFEDRRIYFGEEDFSPPGSILRISINNILNVKELYNRKLLLFANSDSVLNSLRVAVKDKLVSSEDVCINFFTYYPESNKNIELINPVMDKNGRVSHWPRGFFDEWEETLTKLLT